MQGEDARLKPSAFLKSFGNQKALCICFCVCTWFLNYSIVTLISRVSQIVGRQTHPTPCHLPPTLKSRNA